MRKRSEQPYIALFQVSIGERKALSAYELSSMFSIHLRNTRPYLKLLHEEKRIYVSRWVKRKNGPAVPYFSLNPYGDLEDAEYPKALTQAEIKRRTRLLTSLVMRGEISC